MGPLDNPDTGHGGDLADAERLFGRPRDGWLDLSTGVNAEAYPDTDVPTDALRRLPQPAERDALLARARACYGVPRAAGLIAAAGSQALIQWLPVLFEPRAVAVVGPTYSEHRRAWAEAGHPTTVSATMAEAEAADVVVVVNPNNPDGRAYEPDVLIQAARRLAKRGGFLVVDEAFADVRPEISLVPHLGAAPAVVLRSFGKFFGLPGLRLGFAAGAPAVTGALAARLGPWPVAGPALAIGARALADKAWIDAARDRLGRRREALDAVLGAAGLEIAGGTDLFRLVEDATAPAIHARLGRAGVFVRRFPARPDRLRFGVPGTGADLGRLRAALGG